MSRPLSEKDHELAEQRRKAIAACGCCEEAGWLLGADGLPVDPARRCTHTDRTDEWTDL